MAAPARDILDPHVYVKLDPKKIEAVQGLQQLVGSNQINKDRAEYVQSKFDDLRKTLAKKLKDERKLNADIGELEEQLQRAKTELARLTKQGQEDGVTTQLVKEDAEQAESEAAVAKEKEQLLMLESMEMQRMRDDYKKKVHQIEFDFFAAMTPVLERMKLEIKAAQDQTVENIAKQEQAKKEREDAEARQKELIEEVRLLHITKLEAVSKLESLAGLPEKLVKQCDILLSALISVKAQNVKWDGKVRELEAADVNISQTLKHRSEELPGLMASCEKIKAQTEDKERIIADIEKEIHTIGQQVDESLGDRVQLDMQLMAKLHELKHQHDKQSNSEKERDRALISLNNREDLINKLRVQIPVLTQARDGVSRELEAAGALLQTWEVKLVEIKREINGILKLSSATDEKARELIRIVKGYAETVDELEVKIHGLAKEDRKNTGRISELTNVRERLARTAAAKYSQWRETLSKIDFVKNFKENYDKRLVEVIKEHNDALALNGVMRSQRNKFANLVTASAITILEMKDKIVKLTKEVEQFQDEVTYRVNVLAKLRKGNAASIKEHIVIAEATAKCVGVLKEKKAIAEELAAEMTTLQERISKVERDMIRARKIYKTTVQDRNKVGIMLIDCNDELCILYEKSNVQVELLDSSEVELLKRKDEVNVLRRECNLTHKAIVMEQRIAPDPTSIYRELTSLKDQMTEATTMVVQLSELVEKPENLNRWRVLPGRDYNFQELTQKAQAVEEFLSAKEDQAYEKDIILQEVTVLADDLMRKVALARPESQKIGVQFNKYVRELTKVSRQIMAAVSELSLVQAVSIGMKQERTTAQYSVDDAYEKLEKGQIPTEKIEKQWQSYLWQVEVIHRIKAAKGRLLEQDEKEKYAQIQKKLTTKTTAQRRPNAYISEENLGLPTPFGAQTPFRASERGSILRYMPKSSASIVQD